MILVNPHQESIRKDTLDYSPEVYGNVPEMLRRLAVIYAVIIFIAICLIWPGPEGRHHDEDHYYENEKED